MDAYGGFQFSVAEVEAIANGLRAGKINIGAKHDLRLTIAAHIIDARAILLADGHTAAYVILEVDEDEWKRNDGGSLNGFSVMINRRFLGNSKRPAVAISADAYWFSAEEIEAAYNAFSQQNVEAVASRLYQFSDTPTILAVLTFATQQVSTIPAGLLCNYIYDSLKNFIGGNRPSSRITLKFDTQSGKLTEAHIETSSESTLRAAINKLPEIINSNSAYEYSEGEEAWKQLDS